MFLSLVGANGQPVWTVSLVLEENSRPYERKRGDNFCGKRWQDAIE
jgi:hypothetical protein